MTSDSGLQQNIYLNDAGSVMRWCVLLDTNCLALSTAVNTVGNDADDVRRFLLERRQPPSRRESRGALWAQKLFRGTLRNDGEMNDGQLNASAS